RELSGSISRDVSTTRSWVRAGSKFAPASAVLATPNATFAETWKSLCRLLDTMRIMETLTPRYVGRKDMPFESLFESATTRTRGVQSRTSTAAEQGRFFATGFKPSHGRIPEHEPVYVVLARNRGLLGSVTLHMTEDRTCVCYADTLPRGT